MKTLPRVTLKTSAYGDATASPGTPLYSSVVFTLGQSLLLSRPNILGCKLNTIPTSPPPGKMKDFFRRLCIARGCFVSRGRRRRQQPHSQLLLPFPGGLWEGPVLSLRKGQTAACSYRTRESDRLCLGTKGGVVVWAFKSIQTAI